MAHFSWYSVASNFQRTNNLVLLYYVFKLLKCRMQNCEYFEEFLPCQRASQNPAEETDGERRGVGDARGDVDSEADEGVFGDGVVAEGEARETAEVKDEAFCVDADEHEDGGAEGDGEVGTVERGGEACAVPPACRRL